MTHTVRRRDPDEAGAVLILALIFAVVTAMIVGALAAWTSNDIKNIGNLRSSRSMLSAADGATQAAMGNIRYVYWTSGSCGGPFTINTWTFTVTCTLSSPVNEGSINSRVVTVNAFLSGNPKAVLQAQVTYDDFASPPSDKNDCNTATPTTCGTGMTVNSWVVQPS